MFGVPMSVRPWIYGLDSASELVNPIQCGFRKNRSTLDLLLNLSTEICNSFLRRQHLVAVFLDIQKAYDQTWRYGILQTLYNWGFRGNLPNFIRNIMTNRVFRVRVGTTLSNLHYQENGVPQGSTLSVILFIIAINSITEIVRPPIHSSLFVDDFAIYCTSTNIEVIERQLQLALNRLSKWSNTTGFTFSANKTCCVHFCRKYKSHRDPNLFLGGIPLPGVDSTKFLGLYFDRHLTWRTHITTLKARCMRTLNVLRALNGTSWGADRVLLRRL